MTVSHINVLSVALQKAEDHTPIGPDGHAPETFEIALERMKPKAGQIHVVRLSGTVKNREDIFNLLDVIGVDSSGLTIFKEPLQSLMPEALNQITMIG